MQILHHYTNACLCDGEVSSMKEAVEKAVAEKANLRFANSPVKFPMCRMDFGGWSIWIREGETSIGCQTHSNENWLKWESSDEAIENMTSGASEWWETYGTAVKATIRVIENQVAKIKE